MSSLNSSLERSAKGSSGMDSTAASLTAFPAAASRLPGEWHSNTMRNLKAARCAQKSADRQFDSSNMSHTHTRSSNISQYQNVHSNFAKKVGTTTQLKAVLAQRINSMETSINLSQRSLSALEEANNAMLAPLNLCSWRQEQRAGRPEQELVRDPCEIALEEEKAVLIHGREKLQEGISKSEEMLKNLMRSLDDLKGDLNHKNSSLSIDKTCMSSLHLTWPITGRAARAGLSAPATPRSPGTAMSSFGAMTLPVRLATPPDLGLTHDRSHAHHNAQQETTRQQETIDLTQNAKQLERAALSLREESSQLIQRVSKDSLFARNQVEYSLTKWIEKTQGLKHTLEECVRDTDTSIAKLVRCNSMTVHNLDSHKEPADLYSTRRELRGGRTPRENIGDPVKTALDEHAAHLNHNHAHLQGVHNSEANCLAELQEMKALCESDIRDKQRALEIDTGCLNKTHFDERLSSI